MQEGRNEFGCVNRNIKNCNYKISWQNKHLKNN